jgi:hypothetical protein
VASSGVSHYAFIGISRRHVRLLAVELRPGWLAGREGGCTLGGAGHAAGRRAVLRFTDRLMVALVRLRLGMPHGRSRSRLGVEHSTVVHRLKAADAMGRLARKL